MVPIALPELSNHGYVNFPNQPPSDPPSLRDIARSELICHDVLKALERGNNTMVDLANTVMYKTKVVAAAAAPVPEDEPPWLGRALDRALAPLRNDIATMKTDITTMKTDITTMKTDITTMKTDITTMKTDITAMKTEITTMKNNFTTIRNDVEELKGDVRTLKVTATKTHRLSAMSYNRTAGKGTDETFEVVPFRNGQDPPEALPALTSMEAIRGLTNPQITAYLKGYYPELQPGRRTKQEKLGLILRAVGITFDVGLLQLE